MSIFELEYSLANAPQAKRTKIKNTIGKAEEIFKVLPLTRAAAYSFGTLKYQIKEQKDWDREEAKRHNIDIMLAGTAIAENAILVSPDRLYLDLAKINTEFQFENWTL